MAVSVGLSVLREAAVLVRRGWCQGADARAADGTAVEPWEPDAEAWSLLGALVAVLERRAAQSGEVPLDELAASLYALADVIETDSLAAWNDDASLSQRDVLTTLAEAEARFEPPRPALPEFHPN
jgi:hypothetical protein